VRGAHPAPPNRSFSAQIELSSLDDVLRIAIEQHAATCDGESGVRALVMEAGAHKAISDGRNTPRRSALSFMM
jgi:hypothetical protein